jgi:hypothetical protein
MLQVLVYLLGSYRDIIFILFSYALFLRKKAQKQLSDSGFGGLGVACWPLVPKFAGLNPAEAVGFFRAKKSSARLPSEGK